MTVPATLSDSEATVWRVLHANRGRVVTRSRLAREAGLRGLSDRRVDALLVGVRRCVGPDGLRNVRGRGWLLVDDALAPGA